MYVNHKVLKIILLCGYLVKACKKISSYLLAPTRKQFAHLVSVCQPSKDAREGNAFHSQSYSGGAQIEFGCDIGIPDIDCGFPQSLQKSPG
jgi:hypothetical protein